MKRGNLNYIVFIFLTVLLSLVFYNNTFKLVDDNWFYSHQKDSEALVIGKIINSRQNGIKSDAGFMGFSDGSYFSENRKTQTRYEVYNAQIGLQGMVYSIMDESLPLNSSDKLMIFFYINSLLISLMIIGIVYFFLLEFGIRAALVCYLSILLSPWLIVTGRNLFWVLWVHFMPITILFLTLKFIEKKEVSETKRTTIVMVIVFLLVLLKSATGFEFMSQFFINLSIPVLYFSIKNNESRKVCIKKILNVFFTGLVSFSIILVLTIRQIALQNNTPFAKGILEILLRIARRTGFGLDKVIVEQVFLDSLNVNLYEILKKYFFQNVIIYKINSFVIFSCLVISIMIYMFIRKEKNKKMEALNIVSLLTILGPLSWFTLARGHSFIHYHINYMLFNIPYSIFAIVAIFENIFIKFDKKIKEWLDNFNVKYKTILAELTLLIVSLIVFNGIIYYINLMKNGMKLAIFTDDNWEKGVLRKNAKVILLENNLSNRIILKKSSSVLIYKKKVIVKKYNIGSERWISVELE